MQYNYLQSLQSESHATHSHQVSVYTSKWAVKHKVQNKTKFKMWLLKNRLLENNHSRRSCTSELRHEFSCSASNSSSCPSCVHQVFVEYANASDSKEAQRLLTGRTFDGKFVVATFYPLSAYKRGYLYQTVQWRPTAHFTPSALFACYNTTAQGTLLQPTQNHERMPCRSSSDDSVISECSSNFCMSSCGFLQ